MHSLTIFKNVFDNQTSKRMDFKDWPSFEALLYALSEREGYKPAKGEKKKGSALISPAVYNKGTTRANANVIHWASWACLDVDDYDGEFEDIINSFGDHYFVCYSTASSTEEHPKFRLVFPLTEPVKAAAIKHFWYALNKEFLDLGDAQTKDLSRMYYVPAQYPNAYNFIFTHKGNFLCPRSLMEKHEYVPPSTSFIDKLSPAMQKKFVEMRKSRLTNTSITWTSYHDCPFVHKKIVDDYKKLTSDWYFGMYKIMVSIAGNAFRDQYPITAQEIETLCREIDAETGSWYKDRAMKTEAERAIAYIYRNG